MTRNARRLSYRGWGDAANRDRLLEAAGDLDPDWILSLDGDERLDATDAAALRDFVKHDALPGYAYACASCSPRWTGFPRTCARARTPLSTWR